MEENDKLPSSSGTDTVQSKEKKYMQKFKSSWLENPDFKHWLKRSDKGETKAYCKLCDCHITCGMSELLRHQKSAKHVKQIAVTSKYGNMTSFLSGHLNSTNKALEMELKICGFLAKHD
ncbi:unnamed protein product [Diatraea saccharalis]|uniref:Uncharacterized protein n=1 Tax=Diatraea saccharalis TaxID=40085 RepID=A0A9N9N3L8_9NEOP|nr:unnamed protein product [Diatraea saccharalis]